MRSLLNRAAGYQNSWGAAQDVADLIASNLED